MKTRSRYISNVIMAIGLSFIITLLLILPAKAISYTNNADDAYRIEEFSINTPGELEVKTSGGHITVEASETNTVRVEMYVRRNGRELTPSDTDLDDYDIEISQSGNKITATADRRGGGWNWGRNSLSVSFVVYTPREMRTDLKTSGGHITANGLDGDQTLSTSGGHLEMVNMKGTVDARTSGGHIEIQDFAGQMDARTSGGHIEAENAQGTIKLRTSGGHISLRELAGSVEANTSGGSIEADLTSIEQYADLRTSGGHINIEVPDGIGLDLELKGNRVNSNLKNFTGSVERDEISGSINGGGPKITARTSGGSVRIRFN